MISSVHYHCYYAYEQNGIELYDTYQSPKSSYNTEDPSHIMSVLSDEIKNVTGRTVTNFFMVGKTPVGTVYEYKIRKATWLY